MLLLALAVAWFTAAEGGGGGLSRESESDVDSAWSFPKVSLEIGSRLPNLMLPRAEGGAPVALYDLLGGKPTLLHIYASW